MTSLPLATKSLRTLADYDDYVAAFNAEDHPGYCAYYAKDVFMNIWALTEKTLNGYLEFAKKAREQVTESLNPGRMAFDQERGCLVVRSETKFRGRGDFRTDNLAGKWGPVYPGEGPLVLMTAWYFLDDEGHIKELTTDSFLLEAAPAEKK